MTDPIHVHLWFLLTHHHREAVTLDEVYSFDSARAQEVCEAAGMIERYGKWVPGVMTARWATNLFTEIRKTTTRPRIPA